MLIPVEIPGPGALRNRWAVAAAVHAVAFGGAGVGAEGSRWVYRDGGGSWAVLTRLEGGRAVLVGNDRDHSETYYGYAEQFGRPEVDLFAGLPDWARQGVPSDVVGPVGFVYAHADGRWWRAPYDVEDGFSRLGLPALGDGQLSDYVADYVGDGLAYEHADEDDETDYSKVEADALAAAVGAGPGLTRDQLLALVRFPALDLDRGVAAAAAFAQN